jgi:spore germination protein KB
MRLAIISPFQFLSLFSNHFIVISSALLPNAITDSAKQDSWIGLLAGYVIGFLLFWALYAFSLRQADLNQPPASIVGHLALVLYIFYLLVVLLMTIRLFVLVVHSYNLPRTPELVLSTILLAVACYAAWYGLESIARISTMIFLTNIVVLFFLPLPIFQDIAFIHLQPVFAQPLADIGYAALQSLASCLEVFYLFSLLPAVRFSHSRRRYRILFWSTGISMFQITFFFALVFFTFGPFLTAKMVFPSIELLKYFRLGNYFERMELAIIVFWTNSVMARLATLVWICKEETGRLFHLRNKSALLVPISLFSAFLPFLLVENVTELLAIYHHMWMFIVPAGILFFLLSRTKKRLPSLDNGSDRTGQLKT